MTWNISRWEKLSLEKSSKSLERPHCCSICKKFLRWASALWASIQSGKKLSLCCVVSLLWYYEWRHVSIYVFVLLFNINFQLLNVFFWQCCSPLVLKGWFQNPPLKLLPTCSRTYLTLQVITHPWTLLDHKLCSWTISRVPGACVRAWVHEQRWQGGLDGHGGAKALATCL